MERVFFNGAHGDVEYGFMKRPIEIKGEKFDYVDIVTPYAFAGPLLKPVEDTPQCRKLLAAEFDAWFQNYCKEHRIVAEYVQFCPLCKNHRDFSEFYEESLRTVDVAIDTTKDDIMMEELYYKRRTAVRNAKKMEVEIRFDHDGEMIDEFLRLYENTIEKYDLPDYYKFDRAFIEKSFSVLKGNVFFAYATQSGCCVSICMVLKDRENLHYHLAANDPEMLHLNGSSLLIYELACYAKQLGLKRLVLGGADDKMWEFKKTFTREGFYEYYVGKCIRDSEAYTYLVEKNGVKDTVFFPAYRASV